MTSRTYRGLGISVLAFFALVSAYNAFISMAADYILWDMFQSGSLLTFRPKWDSWFFVAIFLAIAAATVGVGMRRRWARTVALCSLAGLGIWASACAILPRELAADWFFVSLDRWLACIAAALTIAAFAWLWSPRARAEFQGGASKA
jgi:signal transduction histidine kinase